MAKTRRLLSVVPLDVVNLFLGRRANEPHFSSYEFPILDLAQKPDLISHVGLPVESRNRKTGLTMCSFEADLRASAVTDGDAFGEIEVVIGVSNGTIGAWQSWQWLTQIYVPSGDYDCGRICQL